MKNIYGRIPQFNQVIENDVVNYYAKNQENTQGSFLRHPRVSNKQRILVV